MTGNILTEIFLPVALIIIMLGMSLSLTTDDFKQITIKPKAVFVGLFCQLIFLPLVAFFLVWWWSLNPEIAVGIMLLSACPGGAG
ncbi:MAG: hypothetical protein IGQ45_07770 [Cyanobacterium sp. T60_A2020_053]|nr:hypothetical protein [Cyanobacterium sp. T60_A2020_053]